MENKTKPTTFQDINMRWVEDTLCPSCPKGICHSKATAKQTYQNANLVWYIHIKVTNERCVEACRNYAYKGTFDPYHGNDNIQSYDKKFFSEQECVEYLNNTFYEVICTI